MNILGHTCYLIFNASLFFSFEVQQQYKKENHGASIPVAANDVVFSIHAVALTSVTIFQCFIYERGNQRVSWPARILVALALLAIAVVFSLSLFEVVSWFFFLTFLGLVKLGCSFVKYCPQAFMNCKRRMTIGWSIGSILLDLTGGLLSVVQMFIDSIRKEEWTAFYGNVPKVSLGFLTIFFDLLFIIQHYILFRKNNTKYWRERKQLEQSKKSLQSGDFGQKSGQDLEGKEAIEDAYNETSPYQSEPVNYDLEHSFDQLGDEDSLLRSTNNPIHSTTTLQHQDSTTPNTLPSVGTFESATPMLHYGAAQTTVYPSTAEE